MNEFLVAIAEENIKRLRVSFNHTAMNVTSLDLLNRIRFSKDLLSPRTKSILLRLELGKLLAEEIITNETLSKLQALVDSADGLDMACLMIKELRKKRLKKLKNAERKARLQ